LNELITIEDLLQGNKTINQLDHNAYTWRRAKEELKVQSRTKIEQPKVGYNAENIIKSLP
jgi:hypothetical protein